MLLEKRNAHFRDGEIQFDESIHVYSWKSLTFTSVTTWINGFFPEFDMSKVIDHMMQSSKWIKNELYGKTKAEIEETWKKNNSVAVEEGTKLHRDIELFYNGLPQTNQTIEYKYFQNFVRDHHYLRPFRTEWKIFIEEFKTAGTIDMVFEKPNGKLDIYDWKRCKQIQLRNNFKKFATLQGLEHVADTNYMHYCLQLNIYKYILEKKYNYIVENMVLVCFHPLNRNKNYLLYRVPTMQKETDLIFSHIRSKLA